MARIGITGHIFLSDASEAPVFDAVVAALRLYQNNELHGVTCLARGADQIFARAVLAVGGTFEVILPAADYRERIIAPEDRAAFDDLLGRAASVRTMPFTHSEPEAYVAANNAMLDRCDALIAVWDGDPSRGAGDTAEVVASARDRALPVNVLWPAGAGRR